MSVSLRPPSATEEASFTIPKVSVYSDELSAAEGGLGSTVELKLAVAAVAVY